jgi:hypothetical protein
MSITRYVYTLLLFARTLTLDTYFLSLEAEKSIACSGAVWMELGHSIEGIDTVDASAGGRVINSLLLLFTCSVLASKWRLAELIVLSYRAVEYMTLSKF